jgi:hypothetical protein
MMPPPRPDRYMCRRQARVVRKAPSRWIAIVHCQSAVDEFLDRTHGLYAGTAHKHIQSSEGRDCGRNTSIKRVFAGDARSNVERLAARTADGVCCRVSPKFQ